MKKFKVLCPKTIEETLNYLKNSGQYTTKLLAGGTDLVIQLRKGEVAPDIVIDITGVEKLKQIRFQNDTIRIGAACTFTQIAENDIVRKYAFCLARAASEVGSEQIRNSGTIGGNIANASPAADSLPPLVALGARVTVYNSEGKRRELPVQEVSAGVGKNYLEPDEIITEISFPALGAGWKSNFAKLGRRNALAIARLNMAGVVKYDSTRNMVADVRISLGAVGEVAFRVHSAEKIMINRNPDETLREEVTEILSQTVEKSIPTRSSMPYKRVAVKGLAEQLFDSLFPSE